MFSKHRLTIHTIAFFLFMIAGVSASVLSAQDIFSIEPDTFDENFINVDISDYFEVFAFESFMENISPVDTLMIKWERIVNTNCPLEWDLFVSDVNFSYLPFVSASTIPIQLNPGQSNVYFQLEIMPRNITGCCDIEIVFTDYDSISNLVSDTILYSVRINDEFCGASGIDNNTFSEAYTSVIPNPVQNLFSLVSGIEFDEISIQNNLGRELLNLNVNSLNTYDASSLRQGIYFISFYRQQRIVAVSKFLKTSR